MTCERFTRFVKRRASLSIAGWQLNSTAVDVNQNTSDDRGSREPSFLRSERAVATHHRSVPSKGATANGQLCYLTRGEGEVIRNLPKIGTRRLLHLSALATFASSKNSGHGTRGGEVTATS
jgi:hypothetical protein